MKPGPSKRELYNTLCKFGLVPLPIDASSNIYIDDHGYVMMIQPDGLISNVGKLSFSGEFICKTE